MIRILDGNNEVDRATWLRLWHKLGREPFAHPDYVFAFCGADDVPQAFTLNQADAVALIPLVRRPVEDTTRLGRAWDVTSPYGYGGPFVTAPLDAITVLEAFRDWVRGERLYSAFLRLSLEVPIDDARIPPGIGVVERGSNVVVDTTVSEEETWSQYAHKVRKNVKKAQRYGCRVVRSAGSIRGTEFYDIYTETMKRREADARYFFDMNFFKHLHSSIPHACTLFRVVTAEGEIASAELVLESESYSYSYLGGTRSAYFHLGANDLLKHMVISHTRTRGARGFVLGGGYATDDGIFRYKRSFAPGGVVPFRTISIIGDEAAYQRLVASRASASSSPNDFFPAYRAV